MLNGIAFVISKCLLSMVFETIMGGYDHAWVKNGISMLLTF